MVYRMMNFLTELHINHLTPTIFYFGGMNGYSKFNPLEIKEDTYMPNLYLTAFSINNDEVQIEDRLDEKKST